MTKQHAFSDTRRRLHRRLSSRGRLFALLACLPVTVLFLLFFLIPLLATVATSLLDWHSLKIEGWGGFSNYIRLFKDPVFTTSLKNLLIWVACAMLLHVPMALLAALLLSEKMRGWKFLRTAYFIPQVISAVAWATIFISIFNPSYGLLNAILDVLGLENWQTNWLMNPSTAWPSVICTWVFHIGMFCMIFLGELLSISNDLIEAATVDGASKLQIGLRIKLPLIRLPLANVLILTIADSVKAFDSLYIMTNGAPNYRTETLSLYLYQQYSYADFSYANTIGVIILFIGIVLVSAVRKGLRMRDKDF